MAKKKRNPNVSQETLARARRELYGTTGPVPVKPKRDAAPDAPPAAPVTSRAAAAAYERRAVSEVDLHTQYAYVLHDLRSMGVLATIFMVVLVVLSFVL